MRKALLCIVITLFQSYCFSQIPSLSVKKSGKKEKLKISKLAVEVTVIGNVATTTFDIVFYNATARDLQGDFTMPLAEGQEVCRYALDINGKLREGVLIEKVKARQAFEAVVRQNIDPGIATKTKGNIFSTKIFPIPANGNKRVVLAITETLEGDKNNLYYTLPIKTPKSIDQFELAVKVIKSSQKTNKITSEFKNINFDQDNNAQLLSFTRNNYKATTPLKFTIPRPSNSDYQLFTGEFEKQTYFYLLTKAPKLNKTAKKDPKDITIYWDNSFSASDRNINKELELLTTYLSSIKGTKNITLFTFNTFIKPAKEFSIGSDTSKLINYIRNLNNDGASCFENLKFNSRADEILLFSDGIHTIGKELSTTTKTPVFTFSSNIGSNYTALQNIALKTNGAYINLNRMTSMEAISILKTNEEKFLSYTFNKTALKEIYPNTPTRVGKYFEIAGILLKENAKLTLNYGNRNMVTHQQTFNIKKGANANVSTIWANKKIAALNIQHSKNKDEIRSLGKRFNIITKNTSFIVLDRVQDYVTHKIVPPQELKEDYYKLLAIQKEVPKKSPKEILLNTQNRATALYSWYTNSPYGTKKDNLQGSRTTNNPPPAPEIIEVIEDEIEVEETVIMEYRTTNSDDEVREIEVMEEENQIEIEPQQVYSSGLLRDKDTKPKNRAQKPKIKVLSWMPDAPYMDALRNAKDTSIDSVYYSLKKEHKNRPSFYIHVADLLFNRKQKEKAIRVLSNTLELDLENPELLKVVAKRYLNEGRCTIAIKIYEELKMLRPEEPQSFRDLALAYIANQQYQDALTTYTFILNTEWNRFNPIKDVIINELNNLISLHKKELNIKDVPINLINPMPLDVRITLDWSSNDNDIDLWVIDPNGEKCFYQHTNTKTGGKISTDFTRGYGPEEFSIKKAIRGTYTVYVKYFSESRRSINGPVTIYATLISNYGTKDQESKNISLQLVDNKETRQIGQLEFQVD